MHTIAQDTRTPRITQAKQFMEQIETIRLSLSTDEWKNFCRFNETIANWRSFLEADPYTRHGLHKPRGYPGDATLMDYAYRHHSIKDKVDSATYNGKYIYELTSGARQSQSARERLHLIASNLISSSKGKSICVGSFASGHARELEVIASSSANRGDIHVIAIDNDPLSVSEISAANHEGISVKTLRRNVLRLKRGEIDQLDIAYSMGLFDYLRRESALHALEVMASTVKRGGMFCLLTFRPQQRIWDTVKP